MAAADNKEIIYFGGRGRAELSRLINAEGKLGYKDSRLGAEWAALKPKTPTGQLPVLKIGDNLFAQSCAIQRFLAKQAKLIPADEIQAFAVDTIDESVNDLYNAWLKTFFSKDDRENKFKAFIENDWQQWASFFEKTLDKNNDGKEEGFLVGKTLTFADLSVFNAVDHITFLNGYRLLANFPKLKAFYRRIKERPNIAAYLAQRPVTDY